MHTAAAVNQNAEGERLIGLCGEILDGLWLAIFKNLEIIFAEVGNQRAMFVLDVKKDVHHIHAFAEGGRLLLLGVVLAEQSCGKKEREQ